MRPRLATAALIVATGLAGLTGLGVSGCASPAGEAGSGTGTGSLPAGSGDALLAQAFADRAGDLQVEGAGTVVRVLSDDDEGSRHQRFIVRLVSGQTLLVAHNIDVAPRIADLQEGDAVTFRGVYEWSAEGGTIHWTHRDPDGGHTAGWLRHGGVQYD